MGLHWDKVQRQTPSRVTNWLPIPIGKIGRKPREGINPRNGVREMPISARVEIRGVWLTISNAADTVDLGGSGQKRGMMHAL